MGCGSLFFFAVLVAVLEVCCIYVEAQCLGGTGCLSACNVPGPCGLAPSFNIPNPPCASSPSCSPSPSCALVIYQIGGPELPKIPTSSCTSCEPPAPTCMPGCQSRYFVPINQFAKSLGVAIYSLLSDCQLDSTVPCIAIQGLTTLLAALNTALEAAPAYLKGQYTSLLSCMLDQLESLGAEFPCTPPE